MYLGDFAVDTTFDFHFTTRRFSTGAPHTLAGTPSMSAYEDNSTTQITAGLTLTADFDSITGLNHVRVVATGANGYETGKSYSVCIAAGTVDSVSVVGEVVAYFTIERAAAILHATVGLTVIEGQTDDIGAAGAGLTAVNVASLSANAITATAIANDAITAAKIAAGAIDAATFAADVDAEILSYIVDDATRIDASALNTASGTTVPAIVADTNELQTDWADGGRLDLLIDAILEDTGTTLPGVIDTIDNFLDTEIAAILAAVDTEVAAILALLDDARGEPGQGNPPVNPDMATKVDYLYKSWRNKKDNDGATTNLYADDGTTVDQKQTTSESGGTVTKGEWITGA